MSLRVLLRLAAASFLLVPRAAAADEAPPPTASQSRATAGPVFGVSSGIVGVPGAPGGWFALAPVAAEVGVHPDDHVEATFEFSYAKSVAGDSCDGCGVKRGRVAVNARVHFAPRAVLDPWVGGSIGVERLTLGDGLNATGVRTFTGIQLPRAQAGLDLHPVRSLAIGAYVATELVWYDPDAPAWLSDQWPFRVESGLRLALSF
jgi:hypothetical protein